VTLPGSLCTFPIAIAIPSPPSPPGTWQPSHAYSVGDKVINDGTRIYQCVTAGTSAASGGPTGTGVGITDGTCVWDFVPLAIPALPTFALFEPFCALDEF